MAQLGGFGQAGSRVACAQTLYFPLISAPLELRLNAQRYSQKLNIRIDQPLKSLQPGVLSDGQIHLSLDSLEIQSGQVWLQNLRIVLSGTRWDYKAGGLLEVQCRNPRLWVEIPRLPLPLASTPSDFAVRSQDSKYRLIGGKSLRTLIEATLRPLLEGAALSRSLHFEANCPGSTSRILEAMLRARVENFPTKDPANFSDLLNKATKAIEGGLWIDSAKLPFRWPQEKESEMLFRLSADEQGLALKLIKPQGVALSPQALSLLHRFQPPGPHVQAVLGEGALSGVLSAALPSVSGSHGFRVSPQGLYLEIPNEVTAADFAPFVPELRASPGERKIRLRLAFRDCQNSTPSWPRLKPWIASSGRSSGFDLEWGALLDLVDATTGEILASRNVESVRMVLSSKPGTSDWLFERASRISTPASTSACSVAPLPVELQLTLDWVLNAENLKAFINQDLLALFHKPEVERLERRMIGRAAPDTVRSDGGYKAEALVLEWPLN
jgi:hypothetical protein